MYMARKIRTQLYLEENQKRVLEEQARLTGKSAGQLVREAVDKVYLGFRAHEKPVAEEDALWDYIGAGKSRETDVSARHDFYLYGAAD